LNDSVFKSYDDLPLMLSVPDLVALLGISRAGAYELVKRKDFPALHIGKRVLVPKDKLIAWIEDNAGGGQM